MSTLNNQLGKPDFQDYPWAVPRAVFGGEKALISWGFVESHERPIRARLAQSVYFAPEGQNSCDKIFRASFSRPKTRKQDRKGPRDQDEPSGSDQKKMAQTDHRPEPRTQARMKWTHQTYRGTQVGSRG
jgi:hypothetical protein